MTGQVLQATADVLVVEDDPDLNELVGAYAQLSGFGYRAAATGASALSEAKAHPPALVLLDLMLPDMEGFDVCRRLKSEPATAHVPVVFLTCMDKEECRARGMACGAAAFLTKPFDPERLMNALRLHACPR